MNLIIESYKNNFKSPIGAYSYILLNQYFPELFTISSEKSEKDLISNEIESIFKNANNLEEILNFFNSIDQKNLNKFLILSGENNFDKNNILSVMKNLKYSDIDFSSFDCIQAISEYNKITPFLNNKIFLQKKLKQMSKNLGLAEIRLNYNFNPNEFLNEFEKNVKMMADVLNFDIKNLGLGVLKIEYKCNFGDFTGFNYFDKLEDEIQRVIVINKMEVFAHEWMHFIDSCLGLNEHRLTSIIDLAENKEKAQKENLYKMIKNQMNSISEFINFKGILESKEAQHSTIDLEQSLISASHFFNRYAKNLNIFEDQVKNLAKNFKSDYLIIGLEKALENMENKLKTHINDPYPARYFSFLKAQCVSYVQSVQKIDHQKNQLLSFADNADKFLNADDYTKSTIETFARTFESFLFEKLKDLNLNCKLLAPSYDSDFYPQGNMKEKFKEYWNKLSIQIGSVLGKDDPYKISDNISGLETNLSKFKEKHQNLLNKSYKKQSLTMK